MLRTPNPKWKRIKKRNTDKFKLLEIGATDLRWCRELYEANKMGHRKHSIFEYFLPDGFDIGSFERSISNARFMSRIRVRSRSHAVFLYSVAGKYRNEMGFNWWFDDLMEARTSIENTIWIECRWALSVCRWLQRRGDMRISRGYRWICVRQSWKRAKITNAPMFWVGRTIRD